MVNLLEKIETRLNHLEELLKGQAHIDRPEYVNDVIISISKFWSTLKEEDRDYVQAAQYALENKVVWKTND
jgi:hypothetical protein